MHRRLSALLQRAFLDQWVHRAARQFGRAEQYCDIFGIFDPNFFNFKNFTYFFALGLLRSLGRLRIAAEPPHREVGRAHPVAVLGLSGGSGALETQTDFEFFSNIFFSLLHPSRAPRLLVRHLLLPRNGRRVQPVVFAPHSLVAVGAREKTLSASQSDYFWNPRISLPTPLVRGLPDARLSLQVLVRFLRLFERGLDESCPRSHVSVCADSELAEGV